MPENAEGCIVTPASPMGQGRGLLDPPGQPVATTIRLPPFFFFETLESPASLFLETMRNSSSSGHAKWQAGNHSIEARLERCLEGTGRLLSDSLTHAESRADLQRARHECTRCRTTCSRPRVISQRRSQKTLSEQAASRTKGNAAMEAATQARERQEEANLSTSKHARIPQKPRRFSTAPSRTLLDKPKCSRNTSRL